MKKVVVAVIALMSVLSVAHAQSGSILVGGSVGLSSAKSPSTPNDTKQTSFGFAPTVGYQFNDNWTAGIVADIQSYKATNSANVTTKSSGVGVGPFVRYTKELSNIFSLYGQLQGVFGTDKVNGSKTNSFTDVNLFPAVFVNVKNGFGLNFSFGGLAYASNKATGASSSSNSFSVSFGQSANIGISKNFGGNKKK